MSMWRKYSNLVINTSFQLYVNQLFVLYMCWCYSLNAWDGSCTLATLSQYTEWQQLPSILHYLFMYSYAAKGSIIGSFPQMVYWMAAKSCLPTGEQSSDIEHRLTMKQMSEVLCRNKISPATDHKSNKPVPMQRKILASNSPRSIWTWLVQLHQQQQQPN